MECMIFWYGHINVIDRREIFRPLEYVFYSSVLSDVGSCILAQNDYDDVIIIVLSKLGFDVCIVVMNCFDII